MSSFKIGIIGAGYIARKHLEVIKKINGLQPVSITSRTYSKAVKIAEDFNGNCNLASYIWSKNK